MGIVVQKRALTLRPKLQRHSRISHVSRRYLAHSEPFRTHQLEKSIAETFEETYCLIDDTHSHVCVRLFHRKHYVFSAVLVQVVWKHDLLEYTLLHFTLIAKNYRLLFKQHSIPSLNCIFGISNLGISETTNSYCGKNYWQISLTSFLCRFEVLIYIS